MNITYNKTWEEGYQAAKAGLNSWDNPYEWYEGAQMIAWDEGFKEGSK